VVVSLAVAQRPELLLLGPAYALSYLLLRWRRSWGGALSS
jgi:hypothetical protein